MKEKFIMDFYEWLDKQDYKGCLVSPSHVLMFSPKSKFHFEQLPFLMQYCVLEAFFFSVDIVIDIHPVFDYHKEKYIKILEYLVYVRKLNVKDTDEDPIECKTPEEAKLEAIKKAKEIYNKN